MHICSRTLGEHGCAECLRTRTHNKRVWVNRMFLESQKHEKNSFLTLTYDEDNLPHDGSLVPDDVTNFLKSFRQEIYPHKVRYFFVGEYGDDSQRPHYHAALFGVGLEVEDIIRKSWKKGHIMLGTLTVQSCRYVAGYVTKKMVVKDGELLDGRYPEFTRMSRRPGIGAGAVDDIARALDNPAGQDLLRNEDIPQSLRVSGQNLPLGRYLRLKLRDRFYDTKNPIKEMSRQVVLAHENCQKADEKMQALFQDYCASSMSKKMNFLTYLQEVAKQKNLDIESQHKINQIRKTL